MLFVRCVKFIENERTAWKETTPWKSSSFVHPRLPKDPIGVKKGCYWIINGTEHVSKRDMGRVEIQERSLPSIHEVPIRKLSTEEEEKDPIIMNGGKLTMMSEPKDHVIVATATEDISTNNKNMNDNEDHDDKTTNENHGEQEILSSGNNQNSRRKLKAKLKKQRKKERQQIEEFLKDRRVIEQREDEPRQPTQKELNIEIEYVHDTRSDQTLLTDPTFSEYAKIFEKFRISSDNNRGGIRLTRDGIKDEHDSNWKTAETDTMMKGNKDSVEVGDLSAQRKEGGGNEAEERDYEEDLEMTISHDSRKKRKRQSITVAELKQLVKRSELVDWVDVTASDPIFLVHLKSAKNVVPVPQHWSQKRKYLQGKRGIVKSPFELPSFIRATGITELRETGREKEIEQSSKQKARAKVQPKMGKIEIDYQKLHDAFFRYQTKPLMTRQGDL